MQYRFLFLIFILVMVASPAFAKKIKAPLMKADKTWVRKELTKMGLSKSFVNEAMKSYEPESFEKTLTLNLLGFLNPPGQHMNLVTPKAIREAGNFINENRDIFRSVESTYNVSPEVISSLLWIETRHGEDMGSFHTLSVYMHLLQTNLKKNKQPLTKLALVKNKNENEYTPKALRKLMAVRTQRKSDWAKEQLIALAAARKNKNLDMITLRGSYAGAFGLPQFIPSSYLEYAQSIDDTAPDLQTVEDAIYSVAHYLAKHGWQASADDSKVNALMKYNNSRDYADSILAISKEVTVGPPGSKTRALSSSGK